MTESIKQEIINNIFENGDKLITGPILQTVLIDMIDDVNVKDQAILSKTGSWDDAATQIPNLATKEEVTNLSESVARDLENVVDVDLTGYATEQWVQNQGYLKEHQDLSDYATKVYVNEAKSTLESNLNNLSSSVSNDIQNKGEEVKTWVQDQGYLKEHQDISGLATKTELTEAKDNLQGNITSLSESVARDLANVSVPEGVATEAWVQSQDYASKSYVDNAVSSSSVDLTGYATETWVESQGYLKEHQDISGLATKSELNSVSQSVQTDISNLATKGELNEAKNIIQDDMIILSGSMAKTIDDYTAGLITEIQNQDYASKTYVNDAISSSSIDLTGYATETWVQNQGYLTEHQDISNLATKAELTSVSESIQTDISNLATKTELNDTKNNLQGNITSLSESVARDLTGYATETWVQNQGYLKEHQDISNLATKSELTSVSESVQTDITNLSESVASSVVWKKGTGTDSIVQKLTGANEANTPTATETGAIAIGSYTTASGMYSHAEGVRTNASGVSSHAEGSFTNASGNFSHAEGDSTVASNEYEHAQGRYNHSSENQIFSIGTGTSTADRRNAVSVLEVNNSGRYTSSFFVQNVGGYDGTNPTPGTNDLATVISGLSSGGGSSETLWKKGTGTDSIVQILTGVDGIYFPTATGTGAVATGKGTEASGDYSHAEGNGTIASGSDSHAEGFYTRTEGNFSHAEGIGTNASGNGSHAEGDHTNASNYFEHAQGRYNHSSANQIFSIGTGNSDTDRRNAVSVLEVSNNDSYTSSFFVQNVGGYDGTNPIPGTNDLATVINNLPSGGGSGDYLPLTGGTLTGNLQVNSSMGVGTGPQGTHCLAVGDSNTNTAGSHYALAVGENCQVYGAYGGVSLGRENVVNSAFGLATGFRCRTTYMAGYAGGCRSTASANFAFAAGFGAEATRVGQVVLGAYNELDPSGNNDSTGSYAVILANGKSSTWHQDRPGNITRSNGLAIKWDGGIDIKYQGSTVTLQDKLNEIEAKISSGGTGTSTETWTFTLDDGTTVTKNIVMA